MNRLFETPAETASPDRDLSKLLDTPPLPRELSPLLLILDRLAQLAVVALATFLSCAFAGLAAHAFYLLARFGWRIIP
jgi:hypothetical protein